VRPRTLAGAACVVLAAAIGLAACGLAFKLGAAVSAAVGLSRASGDPLLSLTTTLMVLAAAAAFSGERADRR